MGIQATFSYFCLYYISLCICISTCVMCTYNTHTFFKGAFHFCFYSPIMKTTCTHYFKKSPSKVHKKPKSKNALPTQLYFSTYIVYLTPIFFFHGNGETQRIFFHSTTYLAIIPHWYVQIELILNMAAQCSLYKFITYPF